ncbi:hypothetical protein Nepgr_002690 [Nepenthes gracilis]|uniref:Uncharacterized protein n=1 Tax=Nepenthes gracilis TaxID=150966 RepID=A0AAD3P6P6_NEPGR|nr:hypothetical protein Nepgr_002690 [Nepenthes gracilis]
MRLVSPLRTLYLVSLFGGCVDSSDRLRFLEGLRVLVGQVLEEISVHQDRDETAKFISFVSLEILLASVVKRFRNFLGLSPCLYLMWERCHDYFFSRWLEAYLARKRRSWRLYPEPEVVTLPKNIGGFFFKGFFLESYGSSTLQALNDSKCFRPPEHESCPTLQPLLPASSSFGLPS